ncbi:hypothetical protein TNCT_115792 [Trichonephila clavata]|uniref:Sodium/calcium exchanger membrane region domain-containing protein n=1 Tax=Trichonephila clavata TaxID=2740835 RepID=A0A8X6KNH8_TRICU|nr:hypothetical protein TNCT_115792 [Trichonephila clavata]
MAHQTFFSSVAGTEQGRPELVIGTLFGAGIFVTSVVVGSIIVSKPFKIMERPFLRDIIFYVCAAFWTFLRFYYGEVTLWHSIGFIALYILYILVVIISRIIYNKYKNKTPKVLVQIEIQPPTESEEQKKAAVTIQPTGDEDNPEAAGVVLRSATEALAYAINVMNVKEAISDDEINDRFSFRGSISVAKKRHSSVHSHHEHVIKALTQSMDSHSISVHSNGHPPPLDTQISKTSLSSLLSSNGEQTLLREFLMHIFPIDIEAWQEKKWPYKIFDVIKAPVCCLLIFTVPVVDYENDKNNWCRPLNVLHILSAPMFVILALGYNDFYVQGFPLWAIVFFISIALAVVVFFTSSDDIPPIYHCVYGYFGFATSVIWVYLLASEIVSLLQTIGVIFKLSDTILGLTVLAWGNSIGDFISNLSVARQGYPRMGISACYGGPLLTKIGRPLKLKYEKLVTLLYSTLTIILLATIVTMTFMRFQAKRPFGAILIGGYFVFLAVAILLETGII